MRIRPIQLGFTAEQPTRIAAHICPRYCRGTLRHSFRQLHRHQKMWIAFRAKPTENRLEQPASLTLGCKCQALQQSGVQEDEEEEDLLLPEEDWTVSGGYQDSLSKNTKLGKAVDDACKELDTLGELERESLVKANELLKKLGYKGDVTAPRMLPKT